MSPVHVRAEPGDFAESVLLPGDPLRAKYIAENFFEDAKLITEERGMLGYTGTYRGEPVSVQTTGMGCPSASIATEELIQLGAKNLLRVGTCGGYSEELRLGDLIVAASAIFTIAAMRGVKAGCLLTVSDTIGQEIVRISDEELRAAVDNMIALALDTLNALN